MAKQMANEMAMLKTAKTIAVVGLSSRRWRPSYGVSEYMKNAGYKIIPVNPKEVEVLGEKAYPALEDIPEQVDIVNIFRAFGIRSGSCRRSDSNRAKMVWMQESVVHPEAAEKARAAGLMVVMDRCILKEHRKLS